MLKKIFRLGAEKLNVEKTIETPNFVLKIAKNNKLFNRFGFVVSKKIDKRATSRNKNKRKLRSCVEQIQNEIQTGFDFLFIAKKAENKSDICEIVTEIFKKNGLLK